MKHADGQLPLGLTLPPQGRREAGSRTGLFAAEAARLLAEIGYEVAASERGRFRLTVEALLRDWTVTLEERHGTLFARTYVMRAPDGDPARARLLEALMAANARTPGCRFALDAGAVVLDGRLTPAAGAWRKDELRTLVRDLVGTCNERYPQLLALAGSDDFDFRDDPEVLRVA